MIERFPENFLQAFRSRCFSGTEGKLVQHLGVFVLWFGGVELQITHALAAVLQLSDFDRMDYLIRGMDARVKCQRLRQTAKVYWPLGSYLSDELQTFEEGCIPTRNQIAHSWPILNEKSGIVHYASISKFPDIRTEQTPPDLSKTEGIHIDDLISQAIWLNGFAFDIIDALEKSKRDEPLETTESRRRRPLGDR